MTVAVLLALATVVSYFGDSTGQAVRYTVTPVQPDTGSDGYSSTAQQRINPIDPGNSEPCTVSWTERCDTGEINGYNTGLKRDLESGTIQAAALAACKNNKAAAMTKWNDCKKIAKDKLETCPDNCVKRSREYVEDSHCKEIACTLISRGRTTCYYRDGSATGSWSCTRT